MIFQWSEIYNENCEIIVLQPGLVLIKNWLTLQGQQALIDECREISVDPSIGSWYVPQYESGKKVRLKQMCLGTIFSLSFFFVCFFKTSRTKNLGI